MFGGSSERRYEIQIGRAEIQIRRVEIQVRRVEIQSGRDEIRFGRGAEGREPSSQKARSRTLHANENCLKSLTRSDSTLRIDYFTLTIGDQNRRTAPTAAPPSEGATYTAPVSCSFGTR